MSQYPYDLYVMQNSETVTDDDGFANTTDEEWVFHSKCRDVNTNSGEIKEVESGNITAYSYKIVMPLGTAEIDANTKIKVVDGNQIRLTGNVIRFSSKQLHCRLWV